MTYLQVHMKPSYSPIIFYLVLDLFTFAQR